MHWVGFDGSPLEVAQGMTVENLHIFPQFFRDVISGHTRADTSVLGFRDPDNFIAGNIHAGNIHACFPAWESIEKIAPFKLTPNILRWIQDCVDVQEFLKPFKGQYKGEHFNSALPPPRIFPNAISCNRFGQFISDTIVDRLLPGAISLWGNLPPPYLVMPLTVEPSKPCLCNDHRFLNL